jgi:hypothetical protein
MWIFRAVGLRFGGREGGLFSKGNMAVRIFLKSRD